MGAIDEAFLGGRAKNSALEFWLTRYMGTSVTGFPSGSLTLTLTVGSLVVAYHHPATSPSATRESISSAPPSAGASPDRSCNCAYVKPLFSGTRMDTSRSGPVGGGGTPSIRWWGGTSDRCRGQGCMAASAVPLGHPYCASDIASPEVLARRDASGRCPQPAAIWVHLLAHLGSRVCFFFFFLLQGK